jgi:serine protease inhibitor
MPVVNIDDKICFLVVPSVPIDSSNSAADILYETHDKIRDMMPKGSINGNTIMVLANAIYFKGMWKRKFDARRTIKKNFMAGPNNQMQVDMMHDQFKAMSGEHTALSSPSIKFPFPHSFEIYGVSQHHDSVPVYRSFRHHVSYFVMCLG